jgi:hypothetical protein
MMGANKTPWITPRLVLGLTVMFVGLLMTLENFGVIQTRQWIRFWPVLLIVMGLLRLATSARSGQRGQGYVLTLAGLGFLLLSLGVLRVGQAVALFILGVGGGLVFRSSRPATSLVHDPARYVDLFAFMGGLNRVLSAPDFKGGHATALMGGGSIDLRRASMEDGEAVINVFAMWGGWEIRVPEDWTVEIQVAALLGGFDDKARRPDVPTKKLILTGLVLMGGIEVKN